MDNTVPKEALDNPGVIVELAGRSFTFREPGNRRNRGIRKQVARISATYRKLFVEDAETKVATLRTDLAETGDGELLFEMVDAMQDVVHDALGVVGSRKGELENETEAREIMRAYSKIVEVTSAPFGGGPQNTDPAQVAE